MFNEMFGANTQLTGQKVFHDGNKATGYNLGFNKGSFATAFDKREYFEQIIRPQNKKTFEPGIQANRNERNNATFIRYDRQQKEDFEDKVQRYMDTLTKEEKEQ